MGVEILGSQRGDDAFGQAVELDQLAGERVARRPLQRRRQRRAAAHDRLQRRQVARRDAGQFEDALELHGHEAAVGDAVTLDRVDQRRRAERRQDHDGAPDDDRAQHCDPADVRIEPERADSHAVAAVPQGDGKIGAPVIATTVRVHDALGRPVVPEL